MHGILLVDKPSGWTSFDVVNKIRHLVEQSGLNDTGKKRFPVGHTGTLDPLATGLLVLMLGTYTKKVPTYTKMDKTYEVTLRLGQTSTTGDEEGQKTAVSDQEPPRAAVEAALDPFRGEIMQTPPAFSAVKINGQRAYKLARKGEMPQLQPRPVRIDRLELVDYHYPSVRLEADVSSGTYIRSLVEDLAKALQTGAYMTGLRRTRVGPFQLADALRLDQLSPEALQQSLRQA